MQFLSRHSLESCYTGRLDHDHTCYAEEILLFANNIPFITVNYGVTILVSQRRATCGDSLVIM